jgi:hypothetical protein
MRPVINHRPPRCNKQSFSQVATEIAFCIIVKFLAKIETVTMPKLREQEQ